MKEIVFDLESNGLKFEATVVWCLVAYDLEEKKLYKWGRPEGIWEDREEIRSLFNKADKLICHNLLNFDLTVLDKLGYLPYRDTAKKAVDTLIMSQLFQHDRPKPLGCRGGPHSLEAWGIRNNIPKPAHEDWSQFSNEMMKRCVDDVKNNVVTYRKLLRERDVKLSKWDWSLPLQIEHAIAQIHNQQELNGWEFDKEWAESCVIDLEARCKALYEEIRPSLNPDIVVAESKAHGVYNYVKKPFLKSGKYNAHIQKWAGECGWDSDTVGGAFTRIKFVEPDLNKTAKLKEQMLRLGWQPLEWNTNDEGQRTSPKVTEESLDSLEGELGKNIRLWTVYRHRKSQIEGWLSRLRPDGRITAEGNPLGAVSGRYTHKGVVNVPKADPNVIYGWEMRRCFIAKKGYKLVGMDAAGLELRMLAHYMDDEDYTHAVVYGNKDEGTDVHTINQKAAGLETRDLAKTFVYGLIYGAGDSKIGKIVNGTSVDGSGLRNTFLQRMPKLKKLIDKARKSAKNGYITGLDGRRLIVRSEHKTLNTLLQGGGAIVMKVAGIYLDKWVRREGLDVKLVAAVHDEYQAEVHPDHVERYKFLAEKAMVQAGKFLSMNCPMAGEAQEGDSWASTH